MADSGEFRARNPFTMNSYDTALCVIPPQHRCEEIDKLRSLYDKAYEKWPPHINLIYPFVAPELLPQAKEKIMSQFYTTFDGSTSRTVALGGAGIFKHRKDTTIFLQTRGGVGDSILETLRSAALRALDSKPNPSTLHLTIGQAQDNSVSARQFLVDKVNLLPSFEFDVGCLAILVREKPGLKADIASQMRLWGAIEVPTPNQTTQEPLTEFWNKSTDIVPEASPDSDTVIENQISSDRKAQHGTTFFFDRKNQIWRSSTSVTEVGRPAKISVSSYNILIDSEYPPSRDRDPILVDIILAKSAVADILILQEVSDEFLSHLLQIEEVRDVFPYASHGPPSQPDIGPLPSLRNIVILSKWHFDWEFLPFQRRHKGALIASFPALLHGGGQQAAPLIVAAVHLTAGLTDGAVVAKKIQLQNVVNHLERNHSEDAWIIAGDFNLPTSRYTIDEAVKDKSISHGTASILGSVESNMSETGFLDAWAVARVEGVDLTTSLDGNDLFEGEEGATFNPRENPLAAYSSGTSENRPQRYDRIFFRSRDKIALNRYNQFGRPEVGDGSTPVGSDHYGIRTIFQTYAETIDKTLAHWDVLQQRVVHHKKTPPEISGTDTLTEALSKCRVFPTQEDEDHFRNAFGLIKRVLLGSPDDDASTSEVPMVVVPVGSYALNVWTPESDIDCLCIGSISSKTFFKLARQRILKADVEGVRILRKVEANTGTMLELSVNGVNMDLQYCPAANIVHR